MNSTAVPSPPSPTATLGYGFHLLGFTAATVIIIAIVGTIGNLLAILSLMRSKKLRQSPSTIFMVNLPSCILPVCALGMPLYGIGCLYLQHHGDIIFPDWVCVAAFTVGLILCQVHLHTICAIAFNRLLAVMWPGVYKRMMQPRWVKIYLLLIWLYSMLLWLPLAFKGFGQLEFERSELMVSMKKGTKLMKAIHVFFTFILPIFFTGICYLIMYWKMRHSKQSREVRRRRKSVTEDSTLKQWDEQVARTILIIFVILVFCNLPHMAIHIIHLNERRPAAWIILHLVFWLQFCLDPVVYLVSSHQYRRAARDLLKHLLYPYFSPNGDAHTAAQVHPNSQNPPNSAPEAHSSLISHKKSSASSTVQL